MDSMAILFDSKKCIGCRACQVACKQWNDLDGEETNNRGSYENPPDLSYCTWSKIEWREVERNAKVEWLFTNRSCYHCTNAACEESCPSDAIYHTPEGFVVINYDNCVGCGICIDACPYDVPRLDERENVVKKCNGCFTRLEVSLIPACVKACPTGALSYGDRNELLKLAETYVAKLKDAGYSNACLYGANEFDGLHFLSILSDNPSLFGIRPRVPEVPQP